MTVTSGAGTSTSPNEKMLLPRYFRSPSGMVSWSVSTPNDGTAMITSTMMGTTVQTTSTSVLCVVVDGLGLALALKRSSTMPSSTATRSAISTAVHSRMPSWKTVIESMIGVTEGWRPIWPGIG